MLNDVDEKRYRQLQAFKPEGSVAVPLVACAISTDKKEMAYVDTLAMQSKLGAQRRRGEESMSLRDSEIVQQRNIMGTSAIFSGGGPTKIADSALPFAVMGGRGPALLTPVAPPTWLKDGSKVGLSPSHDPMKPMQPVQGKQPKKIEVIVPSGSTLRLPEDLASDEACKMRAEIEAKIEAALRTPVASCDEAQAARQKLAEIQAKIIGPKTVPPAVEEPRLEEVRIEPVIAPSPVLAPVPAVVVKHEPIVVTPVLDQTARIQDLEAENTALVGIVARLAAENKALKAKK